jgi:hypothetical protein
MSIVKKNGRTCRLRRGALSVVEEIIGDENGRRSKKVYEVLKI